ncbi:MAG: peptide deformylase [Rickettsiales bacterium]|nr:peptide deformylase [Rickettsiales bacterium]
MAVLSITYAPHPIFRQKSALVPQVDDGVRALIDHMYDTLYHEDAIGLSAPMVGVALRVAIVDIREGGERTPLTLVNPEILGQSEEMQTHNEASLSYPFISADVTRPAAIDVRFQDREGVTQTLRAEGFLATVIQHEMEYFEGRCFLDHLSRMKRDMLMKKMQKLLKHNPPHVHGEHCQH